MTCGRCQGAHTTDDCHDIEFAGGFPVPAGLGPLTIKEPMTTTTTADRLRLALEHVQAARRINEPGILRGGHGAATCAAVRDKLALADAELDRALEILGRRAASAE